MLEIVVVLSDEGFNLERGEPGCRMGSQGPCPCIERDRLRAGVSESDGTSARKVESSVWACFHAAMVVGRVALQELANVPAGVVVGGGVGSGA